MVKDVWSIRLEEPLVKAIEAAAKERKTTSRALVRDAVVKDIAYDETPKPKQ